MDDNKLVLMTILVKANSYFLFADIFKNVITCMHNFLTSIFLSFQLMQCNFDISFRSSHIKLHNEVFCLIILVGKKLSGSQQVACVWQVL